MPRQVDHDERRRRIAEAVWRLARRGGLEQVTLRQVAAEADVSPRLLQYYFGTRDQVLLGALEILNADAEARAKERMTELGDAPMIRAVVRGVLLELLPLDQERRERHIVYSAYFVRFLTEPALASVAGAATSGIADLVADLIAHAQASGDAPPGIEPAPEAAFLTAGAEGLQTQMLLGHLSGDEALAIIDRQLDRVFAES
ncbi:TetR family transcriptional regulator [Tsukamurella sputi]|uniref:TetR family transcriptional regulator n=1 Tax=Tsukamurella sputi TaxID=2591848 RepID=A0A5C5RI41_9ACTN|nr:TetR family transcriptional regulator C-terminal domain-containing protein [Tsukamurella sputi]TWS22410.1 TetR family transcriptional regulator [Tsukamurella sputi]